MQPRGGGDRMAPAVRKGPWTADEDEVLRRHVREHGAREWSSIRSKGLLPRTGKSCRLRWVNKLRPNLKSGCKFSAEEERVVIDLQAQFGNKWARIATYLPGRTDNDVKNFWSTRQKRLARMLRAPLPRRRSGTGRQSGGGASSSSSAAAASHELLHASEPLCQDQDPCFGMIPFQETTMHHHHTGQSNQEPLITSSHCAGAPLFPGFLAPEPVLPSPIGFAAAGCSSSYSAAAPAGAHHHLSFLCAGDPAPMVDHAAGLVVDTASVGNDGSGVAYMEPKLEQQRPDQFFGVLEEEDVEYGHGHVAPARRSGTPDVLFDDLPPEMFDFFELPPSLPPPPPLHPPSPSAQL